MPRNHHPRCTRCHTRLASSDWRPRVCAGCLWGTTKKTKKKKVTPQ